MQSSAGLIKLIKPIEKMIIIEGKIYKKFINTSLRSENVPRLWTKLFIKKALRETYIVNQKDLFNIVVKGIFVIC